MTVAGEIAWRRRPARYREHALFVTLSPGQAREQLACGARVIMVSGELAALREQVASVRAERPRTEAETLPELREIFTAYATPVRLAELARLAGLPDHLVTGRQIAVLARVEDPAGAAALAALLHRQRLAPAEVVAWRDQAVGAAAAEPVCYVRSVGAGRVCYLQLGHDMRVWDEHAVRELITRAARWARRPLGPGEAR